MDVRGTPEEFVKSLTALGGTSVLDVGVDCLSTPATTAVILTRFGFLARSLVGYNAAKQGIIPAPISGRNEGSRGRKRMSGVFQVRSKQIKTAMENKTDRWLGGLKKDGRKTKGVAINEAPQ